MLINFEKYQTVFKMDYPKHSNVMQGIGLEKVCTYKVSEGMDEAKCPHV